MPLLDDVDEAIDRASLYIAGHQGPHGGLVGGCAARALETGIYLHLVRAVGGDPEFEPRLAAFCRAHLAAAPAGGALHDALSALICRRVLGEWSGHECAHLEAALASFQHPTQQRKHLFFQVLLAELGALPPPPLPPPRPRGVDPANRDQLWITVLMAALRILVANLHGRVDRIDPADVEFIADTQGADGGWEQHVLATLVALLALHRAGARDDTLARGLAYVRAQVRGDGGVPFIANEDLWVTCLSGQVIAEARPSTCDLNALARFLAARQQSNGGWAYAEGVRQTDADDTSVSLAFLGRHDPVGHREAIRRAQWYLIALQNDDGGFPTFVRGAASEAEITAKAIRALRTTSDASFGGRIARAWRWLAAAQRSDGSFRAEWKLCATYPALHVLDAAAIVGPDPLVDRVRAGALASLRQGRLPTGGWAVAGGHEVHLLSTAYAIAGLATDPEGLDRVELGRSVGLLLELQGRDGGFHGSGDSLGPRPFIYDVPILASIYSLLALSRARVALRRHVRESAARIEASRPRSLAAARFAASR